MGNPSRPGPQKRPMTTLRRELTSLALRALAYAVPVIALAGLGGFWLMEHRKWLPFGLAIAGVTGALLVASRWLALSGKAHSAPPPVTTWPDAGRKAWQDVDYLAGRMEASPPQFGDTEAFRALFMTVLDTVGRHFHPESNQPALELTVAQTLEISERALRDLRVEVIDTLPLVNGIKLCHVMQAQRLATHAPAAQTLGRYAILANRLRRWVFNPPVAAAYELVNLLDMTPTKLAARQAARAGVGLFVRNVGAYAIQAFSGQASLDITTLHQVAEAAPLRILLLGPVNAGKSSLLNAMFSQQRSRRDILPCPGVKGEHILDRDDVPRAVMLDSDGFGGAGDETVRRRLFEAIEQIDLVIAVTSASQAARQLECDMLEEARRRFATSTRRTCPPIVVAATHIDELRPAREWRPPYDFIAGDSQKERSVRNATDAISRDFQVPINRVIPVSLTEGAEYNVEEGLMPAVAAALPEADRAKFLRLVEANRSLEAQERISRRLDTLLAITARVAGVGPRPRL